MKIHTENKLHVIEGMTHTYTSLVNLAKERGTKVSYATVRSRIVSGCTSLDEICAPVGRDTSKSVKTQASKREEKKAEMAAILDRLGPPKRY